MIDVAPGTIVIYSDIACPWSHLATFRLHRARANLGFGDAVRFDHRAFPLELINERPTPKLVLDAEVPVAGGLDPDAGWAIWQRPPWTWPVTTLPALEAVEAAKDEMQAPAASEDLAIALRRALFADSRCISLRHEILAVAASVASVDHRALADALDDGRARSRVMAQRAAAEREDVQGSPHLFLPDGTDAPNPGITLHWEGDHGRGFPVVDADDPSVFDELVERAAG